MTFFDNLLLVCGVGLVGLLLLNLILNKWVKFSPAQSATASALLSIAILIPLSIIYWPGGDVFALYFTVNMITCYAYFLIGKGGIKALQTKDGKHLHWGPISVLLFFLVLIIVDSSFIVLAEKGLIYQKKDGAQVSTRFPGEVPNSYQKKEAYFNDYQIRLQHQLSRGWQVNYGFLDDPKINEPQVFMVDVRAKDNQPLKNAQVVAMFIRPADQRQNFTQTLIPDQQQYAVKFSFPSAGVWQLVLKITVGDEIHEIQTCTEIATAEGNMPPRNPYRPNESAGCKS